MELNIFNAIASVQIPFEERTNSDILVPIEYPSKSYYPWFSIVLPLFARISKSTAEVLIVVAPRKEDEG
jgi:hypothetical protein